MSNRRSSKLKVTLKIRQEVEAASPKLLKIEENNLMEIVPSNM